MKNSFTTLGLALLMALPLTSAATPEQDLEEFRSYYQPSISSPLATRHSLIASSRVITSPRSVSK